MLTEFESSIIENNHAGHIFPHRKTRHCPYINIRLVTAVK